MTDFIGSDGKASMDKHCHILPFHSLEEISDLDTATDSLENGQLLYMPNLTFPLLNEDTVLLTDTILDGRHKNVSYDIRKNAIGGCKKTDPELKHHLHTFMQRYAQFAYTLVTNLLADYKEDLIWGRTSYRPAEIKGRTSSKRKDDTRLHVDSFPASPVNGLRILRVFCNINPYGESRVWNVGEPFETVFNRFAPQIPEYNAFQAKLLHWIKATKTLRTPYDHYMLHLHDRMKLDDSYQQSVPKTCLQFPPHSCWIVFTDQVSHAALSGQYVLEQTFYIPVKAMQNPGLSPLKVWEQFKDSILVSQI